MNTTIGKLVVISLLCAFNLNAYALWECYAADQGGHRWASQGSTQDRANVVALSFCSAYSPNSGSCHPTNCIAK